MLCLASMRKLAACRFIHKVNKRKKRKDYPFGVNLMRSQVLTRLPRSHKVNERYRRFSMASVLIRQVLAAVFVSSSQRFVQGMIRRKQKIRNHVGFLSSPVASLDAQSVH